MRIDRLLDQIEVFVADQVAAGYVLCSDPLGAKRFRTRQDAQAVLRHIGTPSEIVSLGYLKTPPG